MLTVKSQLGEDGQIEISVNDTGPGLPPARPTRYSTRSLRRSHKAAAWAWQSASRSSNRMADGSGPTATASVARRSTSPCQRLPRKQTLPWMQRDSAWLKLRARLSIGSVFRPLDLHSLLPALGLHLPPAQPRTAMHLSTLSTNFQERSGGQRGTRTPDILLVRQAL